MNKIEQLLNEFCPNGVDLKELGEVIDYEQPTRYLVDSTNYNDLYKTPVLTAGQTFILGYTNEEKGIYNATKESPVIIFDDFTTAFKWVDFNFKAKSSAMKMLTSKNIEEYDLRYVFYAMSCLTYSPQDHARQWIQTYSKIQIPIPPIKIQKEIVKILDTFTLLEAELEAELEARKKQYEYYRNDLLSFRDDEVEWKSLKELMKRNKGTKITASQMKEIHKENGSIKIFAGGKTFAMVNFEDIPNKDILDIPSIIVKSRGIIEFEYYNKPFSHKNEFWSYYSDNEKVNTKYVFYYLKIKESYFQTIASKMQMPQISLPDTEKFKIPVPTLEKQQEIVAILDKFDALVNDISIGLPAELEVRRQQYEYYRNKLLTFKVLEK